MRISIILFFLAAVVSLHGQGDFMSSASLSHGSYEAGGGPALEMRTGFLSGEKLALGLQAVYTPPRSQISDLRMLLVGPFLTYYLRSDTFRPFFGAEVMYGDFLENVLRNLHPSGLLRYGPYVGCNFFLSPQVALEASVKYQLLAQRSREQMYPFQIPSPFSAHIGISVYY